MTRLEAKASFRRILEQATRDGCRQKAMAALGLQSRFFFGVHILKRADMDNDWCYDRCRETEDAPDGYCNLWWREGYKSTIETTIGILQGLARDPERTYGIMSYNRPVAKSFLRQIKVEAERNPLLPELYHDTFWHNPEKESPKWSEDEGLVFRRQSNPKEASIEAHGLVDGQPTSRHFTDLHYEDIVTLDTVRTEGALQKTTEAFRNSLNLGARGGRRRANGTRWHYADTWQTIVDEGILIPRIYCATKDCTFTGEPWLLTREDLAKKITDMGPYIAAAQLFMNPRMDSLKVLQESWLRYWRADRMKGLNLYLLCDPASEKKKGSDYTVFIVIGVGSDRNYYVVRWIRDRMSLTEKANLLFKLHQEYRPVGVGYEQYGMQSDIAHFQDRMERDNYRFGIIPLGGRLSKASRIERLVGPFSQGRIYLPESAPHVQYDGELVDVTQSFVKKEYLAHPFEEHDDMLDCLSRILDDEMGVAFPDGLEIDPLEIRGPAREYDPLRWGLEQ